jgi:hypothetical protein
VHNDAGPGPKKELGRILVARRDGLTTAEIAARFGCCDDTIQRRLAELRAREGPCKIALI